VWSVFESYRKSVSVMKLNAVMSICEMNRFLKNAIGTFEESVWRLTYNTVAKVILEKSDVCMRMMLNTLSIL